LEKIMSKTMHDAQHGSPPSAAVAATAAATGPSGKKRWYVVHAYSGMEKSVQRALTERIVRAGMEDKFG
jgi:transcriptional antiterminator NusG